MQRTFAALLVFGIGAAAWPAITVQNLDPNETLRYPVTLVKGTADGATLKVVNRDNKRPDGTNEVKTFEGKYATVVELRQGRNRLRLTSVADTKEVVVNYKPMSTPYTVNVVYVTPNDGDTRYHTPYADDDFDYRARLDTAAKLMQTFTAESMKQNGYGRMTFNLALDADGKVVVRTVKYPLSGDLLRHKDGGQLYDVLYGWLDKQFPTSTNKNIVIMGFSGYDGVTKQTSGATALGGGGMALFGGCTVYTWPRNLREVEKVFTDGTRIDQTKSCDDSAGRGTVFGVASTTIGAWLHEAGHTFGFPHINDNRDIMLRGFDLFNRTFTSFEPVSGWSKEIIRFKDKDYAYWSPYHAAQLTINRWFQPDAKLFSDKDEPALKVDGGKLKVTAPNGLHLLCTQIGDPTDKRQFEFAKGSPKEASYDVEALRKRLGVTGKFNVLVFDKQGNSASIEVK
jgi:hypothetical protein